MKLFITNHSCCTILHL